MIWIPLTLSAVFICIFSPETYGLSLDYEDALSSDAALGRAVRSAYAATAESYNRVARNAECANATGVSEVHYYRKGIICAGINLKPWIIMTTGDCVHNLEVKKIFVTVTVPKGDKLVTKVQVGVKSIAFNPKYKNGQRRNNMALLLIFGQMDWEVGIIHMPTKAYPVDRVLDKRLPTWVYEYQEGELKSMKLSATKDTSVCGALSDAKGYYCVDRKGKAHTYTNENLGIPFIYGKGQKRVLLGHYTGIDIDRHAQGHFFEEVFPAVYWVEEFIHEHPVPPDFDSF